MFYILSASKSNELYNSRMLHILTRIMLGAITKMFFLSFYIPALNSKQLNSQSTSELVWKNYHKLTFEGVRIGCEFSLQKILISKNIFGVCEIIMLCNDGMVCRCQQNHLPEGTNERDILNFGRNTFSMSHVVQSQQQIL